MAEASPKKDGPSASGHPEQSDIKGASSTVAKIMNDMINSRDMQEIIESQGHILERYERTNEMLNAANDYASARYEAISKDFKKHAVCLMEMKKNLETIFKKVRAVKQTLRTNYPEAYEACKTEYIPPDFDEEPETKIAEEVDNGTATEEQS